MPQLLIRNIDPAVKEMLRRGAAGHGRGMEAEARDILRDAMKPVAARGTGLGSDIAALFARHGLTGEVEELRGFGIAAPDLG